MELSLKQHPEIFNALKPQNGPDFYINHLLRCQNLLWRNKQYKNQEDKNQEDKNNDSCIDLTHLPFEMIYEIRL